MPKSEVRVSPQRRKGHGARPPQPNLATRLECAELAPAFGLAAMVESASKPGALQTLREVRLRPGRAMSFAPLRLTSAFGLRPSFGFRVSGFGFLESLR